MSLVACGGNGGTELTVDNYSKYLEISSYFIDSDKADGIIVSALNYGEGLQTKNGYVSHVYNIMDIVASVSGLSQNFNYNDIKITCKLTGTYGTYESEPAGTMHELNYIYGFSGSGTFSKEIVIECDISGNGYTSEEVINLSNRLYTSKEAIDYTLEVVSISGTVTPA